MSAQVCLWLWSAARGAELGSSLGVCSCFCEIIDLNSVQQHRCACKSSHLAEGSEGGLEPRLCWDDDGMSTHCISSGNDLEVSYFDPVLPQMVSSDCETEV